MIILLSFLAMLAYLLVIFLVGWYLLAPVLEWIGNKVQALSIKGADYHHMVKTYKESGEVQDQST